MQPRPFLRLRPPCALRREGWPPLGLAGRQHFRGTPVGRCLLRTGRPEVLGACLVSKGGAGDRIVRGKLNVCVMLCS